MHVSFVTPAWRRFAVTRLALAQRRHLCDELAARGVTADCVVIADDENLEIAQEFGFATIEMKNTLGRKLNAGLEHAAHQGADYFCFIGSDDWLHVDVVDLELMDERVIITGKLLTLVDLPTGRLCEMQPRTPFGVIPWLIPRRSLEVTDFRPLRDTQVRGMDLNLARQLGPEWVFHDPHPLSRVDFKSDVNMTPYRASGGRREGSPWEALETMYPTELVRMAQETSYLYAEQVA